MGDSISSKVSVIVRCRPLLNREQQGKRCLSIANDTVLIGDKKYSFEGVLGEESLQSSVYDSYVKPLVEGCFHGYNATVFAYGQTGSGKTHSIMGTAGLDEEMGIIPRAIRHVFGRLHDEKDDKMTNVRVSMVEIYNDDCRDLLHPDIASKDIMIREDREGRIFFTGAREEVVANASAAMLYMEQGNLNRSTAETLMNQSSSRSHAIFTISIEMLEFSAGTKTLRTISSSVAEGDVQDEARADRAGSLVQAKLHLVDLAGSERAKRTGALGTRLKESVGINQGLLALGKVIRALTSNPIQQHVPYRESKLTRFLQDSLGGNSRTLMLACISSSESNLHETLGTLQYAYRAKAVQNKVSANISVGVVPSIPEHAVGPDMESTVVAVLKAQIEKMETEMAQLQSQQEQYQARQWESGDRIGMKHSPTNGGAGSNTRTLAGVSTSNYSDSKNRGKGNMDGDASTLLDREEFEAVQQNLQRIMRVLGRIQHTLQEHLQHLEAQEANNPAACGLAWSLVSVCTAVVQTLEELQQQHDKQLQREQERQQLLMGMMSNSHHKPEAVGTGAGAGTAVGRRSRTGSNDAYTNPITAARRSTTALLRSSLNESIGSLQGGAGIVPRHEEELATLRAELAECREDLKRDEDIFAEKMRDLKKCRRRIKELEAENKLVSDRAEEAQSHVQRLAQKLMHQERRASFTADNKDTSNSSLGNEDSSVILSGGDVSELDVTHQPQQPRDAAPTAPGTAPAANDVDISVAVAITEPDISQLMEDLETMAREKEELVADNRLAKQKVANVWQSAADQKEEFLRGQIALKERLKELETNIQQKQNMIGSLTETQSQMQAAAERFRSRVHEVESECDDLRKQLADLDAVRQRGAEEVGEERVKRIQYADKLQRAEEQLTHMEQERERILREERRRIQNEEKSNVEYQQAAEHLHELETFRSEYTKLTQQLEQAENKQRKTLDHLSHQISQYKKKSSDSQQLITQLEEKNTDLRNRLERLTKAKRRNGFEIADADTKDPFPISSNSNNNTTSNSAVRAADSKLHRDTAGDVNSDAVESKHNGSKGIRPSEDDNANGLQNRQQLDATQVGEWLNKKVARIVEYKSARREQERLEIVHQKLQTDRDEILLELQPYREKQMEAVDKLKKKVKDIDKKIISLNDKREAIKQQLQTAAATANRDDEPAAELREEYEELQFSIQSYEEHRQEYLERIQLATGADPTAAEAPAGAVTAAGTGVGGSTGGGAGPRVVSLLDEETRHAEQELHEELETLDAEMELNAARIAHEKMRLTKLADSIGLRRKADSSPPLDPVRRHGNHGRSNDSCYDALLEEWRASVLSVKNKQTADTIEAALRQLVDMVVEVKTSSSDSSAHVQQLQQLLDDKTVEYEELVKTMQKSRNDALRRQEQLKRESEDKIAFLLNQLRSLEAQRASDAMGRAPDGPAYSNISTRPSSSSSGSSGSSGGGTAAGSRDSKQMRVQVRGSSTYSTPDKDRGGGRGGAEGAGQGFLGNSANSSPVVPPPPAVALLNSTNSDASKPNKPQFSGFQTLSRHRSSGSGSSSGKHPDMPFPPPHATAARVSVSAGGIRPPSDTLLSELVRLDPKDLNKEIERRWMSEKERREQLETRNAEMMRELKKLRQVQQVQQNGL